MNYLTYLNRIIPAYVFKRNSQLTFWHGQPQINSNAFDPLKEEVGEYYMPFYQKANYHGPFDEKGIPILDYHGKIGKQYNPIAIAQYGLGNYNLYKRTQNDIYYQRFQRTANWLVENIEKNKFGIYVWNHKFDWEYYYRLKSPWYSALAQGQGISLLIRAYTETNRTEYIEVASNAFRCLLTEVDKGGVLFVDDNSDQWLEEYVVIPPTHILNGFIWALWGVYDYFLLTKEKNARELWEGCLRTLQKNLDDFDIGYWSLYDLSRAKMKNLASPFYHKLHIVQLEVLYKLSKVEIFKKYSNRWKEYLGGKFNRTRAYFNKVLFKLFYF